MYDTIIMRIESQSFCYIIIYTESRMFSQLSISVFTLVNGHRTAHDILILGVLKVWSAVKIRGTRVPQNAIVTVSRPRPYSIIIINMRFIPKASLRASSEITASSYILERHL